ncbi:GAF domain-containing protein [Flavobacteriaceae bacterium MAR_2010_188]|nr:GAF domain-containing protein [Flavobacteriaceae bacterium MAR_2010_188]
MKKYNETKRLEELLKYEILDTPIDGAFDEITSLTSKIFNVPVAIITLVDHDRIWFKSTYGIDEQQIPKAEGLCCSAILSDDVYIVEDARKDPRTMSNPLVAGLLGLQFYAAAPLKSLRGYNLGTLCIIDKYPRTLTGRESSMLYQLSRIVMDQMDLKLQSRLLANEARRTLKN